MSSWYNCCIIFSWVTTNNHRLRTILPSKLIWRTNSDHRVNLATTCILYRYRIVTTLGSTIIICTVSCRSRNFQIIKCISSTSCQCWWNIAIHCVNIGCCSTDSVDCGKAIVFFKTMYICNIILHHLQLSRNYHITTDGCGTNTIRKLNRVMIWCVVCVGKCYIQIIRVVWCGHRIRMYSLLSSESPGYCSQVVNHTSELGCQRQLTAFGTNLIIRMSDGNFWLYCNTDSNYQIAGSMAQAVSGFNMIGQRNIASGVIDQSLIVHRWLTRFAISTGDTVRHTHIWSFPWIGSSTRCDIHYRNNIKTIACTWTQRWNGRDFNNSQSVVQFDFDIRQNGSTLVITISIHFQWILSFFQTTHRKHRVSRLITNRTYLNVISEYTEFKHTTFCCDHFRLNFTVVAGTACSINRINLHFKTSRFTNGHTGLLGLTAIAICHHNGVVRTGRCCKIGKFTCCIIITSIQWIGVGFCSIGSCCGNSSIISSVTMYRSRTYRKNWQSLDIYRMRSSRWAIIYILHFYTHRVVTHSHPAHLLLVVAGTRRGGSAVVRPFIAAQVVGRGCERYIRREVNTVLTYLIISWDSWIRHCINRNGNRLAGNTLCIVVHHHQGKMTCTFIRPRGLHLGTVLTWDDSGTFSWTCGPAVCIWGCITIVFFQRHYRIIQRAVGTNLCSTRNVQNQSIVHTKSPAVGWQYRGSLASRIGCLTDEGMSTRSLIVGCRSISSLRCTRYRFSFIIMIPSISNVSTATSSVCSATDSVDSSTEADSLSSAGNGTGIELRIYGQHIAACRFGPVVARLVFCLTGECMGTRLCAVSCRGIASLVGTRNFLTVVIPFVLHWQFTTHSRRIGNSCDCGIISTITYLLWSIGSIDGASVKFVTYRNGHIIGGCCRTIALGCSH